LKQINTFPTTLINVAVQGTSRYFRHYSEL
jgi:hypothetical protein